MIYVTFEKSGGRAGHQYKDAITPVIVSEIFGFTHVHTEYESLEFFNLGEGALRRDSLPFDIAVHTIQGPHWFGVPFEDLMLQFSKLQNEYRDRDCLVVLKNNYRVQLFQLHQWCVQGNLPNGLYERVVDLLRKKFRSANPRPGDQKGDAVTVAVHVRRGDVAHSRKRRMPASQHYAHPMEYYDAILSQLRRILKDRPLKIDVYTEFAQAEDVVAYCSKFPEIHLHQGGKSEFADHFSRMVYSDILVVSNSSMSQMAGYLSQGLKIYHPNNQYHSLPAREFISADELEKMATLHLREHS